MPGARRLAAEPPRVVLARPNLKFNHKLHAARGIACALCHASADMAAGAGDARGSADDGDLPRLSRRQAGDRALLGLSPHGAGRATEDEARQRRDDGGGRHGAAGAVGSLRGIDAHGPTFKRDHAPAGRDEKYCLTCHKRTDCIDCHGGVVRPPDIHPADYVSLHVVDARRTRPIARLATGCSRSASAATSGSGVAADPEGGLPGRRPNNPFGTGTGLKTFHPPGWARDASGAVISTPRPDSHSLAAQRNIRTCVSCHREESCLACHSADPTRGPSFSPHGPGFG